MGNIQSFSSEATVAGAVLIGGVAYYSYNQVSHPSAALGGGSSVAVSKKGKKRKGPGSTEPTSTVEEGEEAAPRVVSPPAVLPGQFDVGPVVSDEPSSQVQPKKAKKKKAKGKNATTGSTIPPAESGVVSSAESSTPVPPASASKQKQKKKSPPANPSSSKPGVKSAPSIESAPSIDTGTDGSWTRVESSRRDKQQFNDLAATTGTEDSSIADRTDDDLTHSPSMENRRTLAERLLPKPRKTRVDDMLETPDYPALSRVMRVQPRPDEKPALGFSWGDYEDVNDPHEVYGTSRGGAENDADGEGDDDNDGWGVVKSRKPKPTRHSSTQPLLHSQPQSSTEQSKRQRQNAAKRAAQKTAKASAEAERLATLVKHKRELEKAKLDEQFSSKKKDPSGGMRASVNANGKLVWE